MTEALNLLLPMTTGLALGGLFFGGLWWTIQKGVASQCPAFWFSGSLLLRMSLTLAGFYVIARSHWQSLLVCLLGFVLARLIVLRLTREVVLPSDLRPEALHASQS